MFYLGKLDDPERHQAGRAPTPVDWPARFEALAEQARDPRLRAYYAAGLPGADTPLADVPLIAMDIETTGLDPVRDGIVSIGLVPMTLERIALSAARQWLLRPRVPLAEASVAIHGITDSQIAAAPDLERVLGEVLEAMAGRVVVAHCRDIERQFLDQALRTRIGEGIVFPVIDTMELEARVHRRKPGWLARLFRRRPALSIRLGPSRARYGLPRYRLHHAPTDALASAELLQAQVAHRFAPTTLLRALWS